jgi:hypothetical protein
MFVVILMEHVKYSHHINRVLGPFESWEEACEHGHKVANEINPDIVLIDNHLNIYGYLEIDIRHTILAKELESIEDHQDAISVN